jgi:hypothetical protein
VGGAKARLIVLIGDVHGIQLFLVGVLAQPVMVEANIHGLGIGCPDPQGDFCPVGGGIADVDLRGMQPPEVPHGESQTPGDAPDVSAPGCLLALVSGDPRVAFLSALAQGESVCVGLAEGEVAPRRDPVEASGDALTPLIERGSRQTCDLGIPDLLAGIPPQSSDSPDRFSPDTAASVDKTHVAVVKLIGMATSNCTPRLLMKSRYSSPSKTKVWVICAQALPA